MRARKRSYYRALALRPEAQAPSTSRQTLRNSLFPNPSQLRVKTKSRWTRVKSRNSSDAKGLLKPKLNPIMKI